MGERRRTWLVLPRMLGRAVLDLVLRQEQRPGLRAFKSASSMAQHYALHFLRLRSSPTYGGILTASVPMAHIPIPSKCYLRRDRLAYSPT